MEENKLDDRPYGYYLFKNGERGWCRPVLDRSVEITYDDGSSTCVPKNHYCLDGAIRIDNLKDY